MLNQARPLHVRHLAAVLLKQCVSKNWAGLDVNEQEEIKGMILNGLNDPTGKIRTAVVSPRLSSLMIGVLI